MQTYMSKKCLKKLHYKIKLHLTSHLVIACSIPFKAFCPKLYNKANKELEQFIRKAKQRYEPFFWIEQTKPPRI